MSSSWSCLIHCFVCVLACFYVLLLSVEYPWVVPVYEKRVLLAEKNRDLRRTLGPKPISYRCKERKEKRFQKRMTAQNYRHEMSKFECEQPAVRPLFNNYD